VDKPLNIRENSPGSRGRSGTDTVEKKLPVASGQLPVISGQGRDGKQCRAYSSKSRFSFLVLRFL